MNKQGMLKYGTVRSDDNKAVSKLQANIQVLRKEQAKMLMENEYHKEHGTLKGCPDVSDETAIWLDACVRGYLPAPNPPFVLEGNKKRIKVMEDNIYTFQHNRKQLFRCWKFSGGEGVVNLVDNSLTLIFSKPITRNQEKSLTKIGFEFRFNDCRTKANHTVFKKLSKLEFVQPTGRRKLSDIQPKDPKRNEPER